MAARLDVYKQMITVIGEYIVKFPATGIDEFFNKLIENGVKTVPTDDKALNIVGAIFCGIGPDTSEPCEFSGPKAIQNFMNLRFSDLSVRLRPLYKDGEGIKTASWSCGECVSDRVKDLVNPEGKATGFWCSEDGDKISLIEL